MYMRLFAGAVLRASSGYLPGLIFAAVFLCVNWQIFSVPIYEVSDFGANAIQVENAKHFRELLGNYSRWHFHHPGPAFFYIWAAGEWLLYDKFRLVPAPLNAHIVTQILLSTFFLFCSIKVIQVHCRRPLFLPLATAMSVLFLFPICNALPGSAVVSVWPPYMILFCFLLLATTCASVATGRWNHLPLMAFAGMMLVHSHIAQFVFVTALGFSAIVVGFFGTARRTSLAVAWQSHRTALGIAAGIVGIFLFPILLELVIHHPNNGDYIRSYLNSHSGPQNSARISILYFVSFLTYLTKPEVVLANPYATLKDVFAADTLVRLYWGVFLSLAVLATTNGFLRRRRLAPFVWYLFIEIALIVGLFLFWASRIAGPLFSFNGFFIFSIQLLTLFGFSAIVAEGSDLGESAKTCLLLACGAPMLLLFIGSPLRNTNNGSPDAQQIASTLKAKRVSRLRLEFDEQEWELAAGVASILQRNGTAFCVVPAFGFMLGYDHVCKADDRLRLQRAVPPCQGPCETVYQRNGLFATYIPHIAPLPTLPVLLNATDTIDEKSNFQVLEGTSRWTKQHSEVRFWLAKPVEGHRTYHLSLMGQCIPGRPLRIRLNGRTVGMIDTPVLSVHDFALAADWFAWGDENVVELIVDEAGPVNRDPRELGYYFQHLEIH